MARSQQKIEALVRDGLSSGYAVSGERISELRAQSQKEISLLKRVFWIVLGLFNLIVWNPMSLEISDTVRWGLALASLVVAFVFPIVGIRRHRGYLYQLEDCSEAPKRRNVDNVGRQYMERVKKQGRYFIRAEATVLQKSAAD